VYTHPLLSSSSAVFVAEALKTPEVPLESAYVELNGEGVSASETLQLRKVSHEKCSSRADPVDESKTLVLGKRQLKPLVIHAGVDIMRPNTLTPELFAGVTQVVSCVGSIYGRLPYVPPPAAEEKSKPPPAPAPGANSHTNEKHGSGAGNEKHGGRGLHSFPFPLNLSLLCTSPLKLSLHSPLCNPTLPVDVSRMCSS
jgi:hypothetical protein